MPGFTLTSLRVVLEVARSGSFSSAAERLGYTQSAVSRQVAGAEAAAGPPLFERHARGVRPTPSGQTLVRHAEAVVMSVTAAEQELVLATGDGLPDYDLDGLDRSELRGGRGIGIAVHASHPYAGRPSVQPADLTTQRWIVGTNPSGTPEFGPWPGIEDPQIAYAARIDETAALAP